jgi:predicted regulator of Ras-like GTPase activity (Roadblock/LC7/MglB family)
VCHVGESNKVVIDLEHGYLLVTAIGPGSALGVIAGPDANVDDLAYDMAVLADRAVAMLTPTLVEELMMTASA